MRRTRFRPHAPTPRATPWVPALLALVASAIFLGVLALL